MNSIIASIVTSVVVSLFTFVLGLKSGKNQADRAFLQSIYRRLYAHFSNLETGIKEKKPKHWEDYKSVSDRNSIRFFPDVRDMERTGDILYVKKRIAKCALDLEADCLVYPDEVEEVYVDIHNYLMNSSELFKDELLDKSYDKKNKPLTRVETTNPTNCRTYRIISYGYLFDKERLIKLLDARDADPDKYALSFTMRGNPPRREFIIYPESLAKTNSEFAESISSYARGKIDCAETEKELIKRLEKLRQKLAKRAKNPTGFWETFAGAFWDIFQ